MRKLLLLLGLLTAFAGYTYGQISIANTTTLSGAGAPSGTCSQTIYYVNTANGDLYDCPVGSWVKTGTGGGTSGLPPGPTTPNGVPQTLTSTPSGGVAGAAAWNLQGVTPNAQTGTSYTIAVTDRLGYVTFSNASPVAVTLPQAGSSGFGSNFTFKTCNIGAGTVTVTPTTSTISYTGFGASYTSGAASMPLTTNQCAFIQSDNTNYFANGTTSGAGGAGTVTSVGLSLPASLLTVSGSPVTTSGTLTGSFASISAHNYLGNNTGSSATAALVQPVCGDLSNSAASCSTDATNATNITSGTLGLARLPTQAANTVLAGPSTFGAASAVPAARTLVAHDFPSSLLSCALLDNAICTSSADANGNPNFLGTAGTTALPINGGTTSLVMFIGGVYQVLNTNVTLTLPSTTGQYWIIAKQDLANDNMVAADFVASSTPPVYDKVAPTCPTNPQGIAVSSTNPAFWFDLSTNLSKLCTSNGGAYSASPSMSIGEADVTGCASCSIDASVAEPYRLNPFKRYQLFSNGSGGFFSAVSSTVTIGSAGVITLGSGGSGYGAGGTLTVLPCGAQATYSQSGGVINTVTLSTSNEGNTCVIANGLATTCSGCGGGSGATINITALTSGWNYPLDVTVLSGGVLTASTFFPGQQGTNSNRNYGVILVTPNPVMVLGTGKITSTAMAKFIAGTTAAGASTTESGGLGGIGGGGGGGTNAGGQSGCGLKWSTNSCADNALGGAANTAGASAGFGPAEPSPEIIPTTLSLYCSGRQGMGASGGPGGGDGTNKGGDGGSAAGYLCIMAPSIFVASGASINCNGGAGGNSAAAGNTGGGGGGGGGICEILVGYANGITRNSSTNYTAAGGLGGTGFGTGGAGGNATAGSVFFKDGIQY